MRTNKISAVLFSLSVIFVVLSLVSMGIYNSIKETIIERDSAIINELQIVIKDIKGGATIESAAKLKAYSQKIMNMDVSFYKNSDNLSDYGVRLSILSSEIMKNIVNDESLPELISEYEKILNSIYGILKQ